MNKKDIIKTVCTTGTAILVCTAMFNTLSEAVMASEFNKQETIRTTYDISSAVSTQNRISSDYKKANYTIVSDSLEYYRNKQPTDKDLTQEQAAEIGAELL